MQRSLKKPLRRIQNMRSKVTVIGAGNVGATTAQRIFDKGYADVVLVDIVEGLPQGKALDMLEAGPVTGTDATIIGTNGYDETANSDVVVVTSGIARKPGMSRDDLLLTNMKIVSSVVKEVAAKSPNCVLLPVTNPLDAMAQQAHAVTGFPKNRVVGMAGILDTARFRTFLAQELNVSVNSVEAYVLGGHGDTMVPVVGTTTVGGTPVANLIDKDRLEEIVQRTRDGGAEIVNYLKTGSAYYAPSASIVRMVESILLDKKEILPCTALLEGEYGINNLFVGVPVKLGAGGVEEVIEIDLTSDELSALRKSADALQELVDVMAAAS
jgi:malate dehydrogenase